MCAQVRKNGPSGQGLFFGLPKRQHPSLAAALGKPRETKSQPLALGCVAYLFLPCDGPMRGLTTQSDRTTLHTYDSQPMPPTSTYAWQRGLRGLSAALAGVSKQRLYLPRLLPLDVALVRRSDDLSPIIRILLVLRKLARAIMNK